MTFNYEMLESFFRYWEKLNANARDYWTYLKGDHTQPDANDYGVTYDQARAIRIRLAQLK